MNGTQTPADVVPVARGRGTRAVLRGVLSGAVGGLCCVVGAVAVGLGLGGVGFFATLMARYQLYFMVVSAALMAYWMVRTVGRLRRRRGSGGLGSLLPAAVPLSVMLVGYLVTLAVALLASRLAGVS
jgi:hypothetical protein